MALDADAQKIRDLERAKPFAIKGTNYNYGGELKNNPPIDNSSRSTQDADKGSQGTAC